MKKIICLIISFVCVFLLTSCSYEKTEYKKVYNYMQATALLCCGDYIITIKDKVPYVYNTKDKKGYSVISDAVSQTKSGVIRLMYAADDSFYYMLTETAEKYGSGNGYRIFRFYPETRKEKLIFKDVSVTNFDSVLGLEDIIDISAPSSGHSVSYSGCFYFDNNKVIPYYKMKDEVLKSASVKNIETNSYASELRFAVSNGYIFFTDITDTLIRYDPNNDEYEKFVSYCVEDFWVTQNNVFIRDENDLSLTAYDFEGNPVKTYFQKGLSFPRGSLRLHNDECYMLCEDGSLYHIDENLNFSKTDTVIESPYWYVTESGVRVFENALD